MRYVPMELQDLASHSLCPQPCVQRLSQDAGIGGCNHHSERHHIETCMGEVRNKCTMKIQSSVTFIPTQESFGREQALLCSISTERNTRHKTEGKENQHLLTALYGEPILGTHTEAMTLDS